MQYEKIFVSEYFSLYLLKIFVNYLKLPLSKFLTSNYENHVTKKLYNSVNCLSKTRVKFTSHDTRMN